MIIRRFIFKQSIIVAIILIFNCGIAIAQDTNQVFRSLKKDSTDLIEKAKQRLSERTEMLRESSKGKQIQIIAKDSSLRDPMLPESPGVFITDSLTNLKYQAALQEYYDYHVAGLKHRMKVFNWQLFSSKIIFAVVLILVFAGIYFAAVQFYIGVKQVKEKSGDFSERTEISASMKGIKVSSPVLGVIILVISLAFFYLYLVYVFPIEDIF